MNDSASEAWHHVHSAEVLRLLGVDVAAGLGADEVKLRQAKFGLNRITARHGTPAWVKFLQQFHAPLVYLLLAAVEFEKWIRFGRHRDSHVVPE